MSLMKSSRWGNKAWTAAKSRCAALCKCGDKQPYIRGEWFFGRKVDFRARMRPARGRLPGWLCAIRHLPVITVLNTSHEHLFFLKFSRSQTNQPNLYKKGFQQVFSFVLMDPIDIEDVEHVMTNEQLFFFAIFYGKTVSLTHFCYRRRRLGHPVSPTKMGHAH